MARRKSHLKTKPVMVRLSRQEMEALERAARQETERRREVVHEAALVRELAMGEVYRILADAAEPVAAAS